MHVGCGELRVELACKSICVEMLAALVSPSLAPALRPMAPTRSRPPRMVAYRVPQPTKEEWIRSHAGLYGSRVLYLGQEIDDEEMNRVIAELLFLDAEEVANQYLYINSPGGSVIAGLALYDTIGHINSEVVTVNVGMAASMASFILGAGERGKRIALPHSRVMIHQPMGGSTGQAEDIRIEAEQILKIKGTLVTMYAQMTGNTRENIIQELDRDNYMSAQEALEFGIIDRIAEPMAAAAKKKTTGEWIDPNKGLG